MKLVINPEGFGEFNVNTVTQLLILTTKIFELHSGIQSPRDIEIRHTAGTPECRNEGDKRIIFLSAAENYYGRYVYEFAHEYLHNLIDRDPLVESFAGLAWFEETLCEAASRFAIWQFVNSDLHSIEDLYHSYPVFRDYLEHCLPLDPELVTEYRSHGSVLPWLPLLEESCYHRKHYAVIADAILPLFYTTPCLWCIIAYIGNATHWQSLEALFAHLDSETPVELHAGVDGIRRILLG